MVPVAARGGPGVGVNRQLELPETAAYTAAAGDRFLPTPLPALRVAPGRKGLLLFRTVPAAYLFPPQVFLPPARLALFLLSLQRMSPPQGFLLPVLSVTLLFPSQLVFPLQVFLLPGRSVT